MAPSPNRCEEVGSNDTRVAQPTPPTTVAPKRMFRTPRRPRRGSVLHTFERVVTMPRSLDAQGRASAFSQTVQHATQLLEEIESEAKKLQSVMCFSSSDATYTQLPAGGSIRCKLALEQTQNEVTGVKISATVLDSSVQTARIYASHVDDNPGPSRCSWTSTAGLLEVESTDSNFELADIYFKVAVESASHLKLVCCWAQQSTKVGQKQTYTAKNSYQRVKDRIDAARRLDAVSNQNGCGRRYSNCLLPKGATISALKSRYVNAVKPRRTDPRNKVLDVILSHPAPKLLDMKRSETTKYSTQEKKVNHTKLAFEMWKLHQNVVEVKEVGGLTLERPIKYYQDHLHRNMMPDSVIQHRRHIRFDTLHLGGMTEQELKNQLGVNRKIFISNKV